VDGRGLADRHDSNRRRWVIAWSLALALHVLVMIGFQSRNQWVSTSPRQATPEPIQLTFVGAPPAKSEPKSPTYFTELPADRKDKAPEHADFLSNVTSRARDRAPDGDQSLPRMSGETDEPSIAMESGKMEPQAASPPPPAQQPVNRDGIGTPSTPRNAVGAAMARGLQPDQGRSSQSLLERPTAPGSLNMRQGEMDYPNGNAALTGDVSLSTTEWAYAPWLERFREKVMAAWHAPNAYSLGILKEGGWTVVEMEIARSGQVLRMDVIEEQGHHSLTLAATSALRSISPPMEALPADFPEKTLVLRIRMFYPKLRPR
jgi:hypothetical protein